MIITAENIIRKSIDGYLYMDLGAITVHCPYWSNKLKDGKVVNRGQFNGKGTSNAIRDALIKSLNQLASQNALSAENIRKLAKREKVGIDCSGLAYRILDELLKSLHQRKSMDEIFSGGINKTNVKRLTDSKLTLEINHINDILPGDLIKMMGGRHVLLVLKNDGKTIEYIHSSKSTEIQGVHLGSITILSPPDGLEKQEWLEKTRMGQNFGKRYFDPKRGDCVKRLKFLQYDNS